MTKEFFLLNLGMMAVAAVLLTPLVRALADRIRRSGRDAPGEGLKTLREELVGEVQQLREELAELAERVDFTERMLAQDREAARLARPEAR